VLLNLPTVAQVFQVREGFQPPPCAGPRCFSTLTKELLGKVDRHAVAAHLRASRLHLALFVMLYNLCDPPGQVFEWFAMAW